MAKRGGQKKSVLQTEGKADKEQIDSLRAAWSSVYNENSDNVVVLNKGLKFQEMSDTAAEMQMNESKALNALEFAKIFHVSTDVISGKAADITGLAKLAAIPLMTVIHCALYRDMLLEREKGSLYFAFDTKELLKGEMKERFDAYKTALDANFMQIDEVRYAEDLEPLGLEWIKIGLQDVLYDPKTKMVYIPNTNQFSTLSETSLQERTEDDILEERGYIRGAHGWFEGSDDGNHGDGNGGGKAGSGMSSSEISADKVKGSLDDAPSNTEPNAEPKLQDSRLNDGGPGAAKKGFTNQKKRNSTDNKYSPSKRRNYGGINIGPKTYARLCGILGTHYPNTKEGQKVTIHDNKYFYDFICDGYGGGSVVRRCKIPGGKK